MKAFLGMGLLGSNFVKAMLRKGDQVQVWNRTASKAKALEEFGAKAFDSAADAVKGADIVHITLKDDATVDEVLSAASPGLNPGALIIDHTTTSADGAVERTAKWKTKGFTYLHAPVFMGPPNALESTGYMLVSGDQQVISKAEPELSKMTGKLLNLGPREGQAAGMKLIGNLFLLSFTSGLSDALSLAKAQGIAAADVSELFSAWNPATAVGARLKRMTDANFSQPSWELQMARKDAGLMISAAHDGGTHLVTTPAIAEEMDKWIAKGHGNDDWTIIARDNI
ncbi:MAG TPA: NAD(P)-dependent oxidoreductase [Mucilaginibacter sp.]|jgi:3-hydroxyisobutyrate dehydrogenase|nr:NAD(P)-dependent oxidoreductase [Mucilaginibacter sp.]